MAWGSFNLADSGLKVENAAFPEAFFVVGLRQPENKGIFSLEIQLFLGNFGLV